MGNLMYAAKRERASESDIPVPKILAKRLRLRTVKTITNTAPKKKMAVTRLSNLRLGIRSMPRNFKAIKRYPKRKNAIKGIEYANY